MTQKTVNKEVTAFVGRYITPRNHLKDQLYIDNLTTRLLVNITEELEESEIPCIDNHGIDYVELKRLYDGHEEETITPEAFAEECDMCSTIHVAIYSAVVRTMDVPEILHGDKFNDIVSDCFRYRHLTEALIVACVKDQADSCGVDTNLRNAQAADHQRLVDKLIDRGPDQTEEFYCSWMWEYIEMDMSSAEVDVLVSNNVINLLVSKGLSEREATRVVTTALCSYDCVDKNYYAIVRNGKLLTPAEWTELTVGLVRAHLLGLNDATLQRYYKDAELAYPEGYVPKPMPALKKGDKYK